jgi:hypothetical protein
MWTYIVSDRQPDLVEPKVVCTIAPPLSKIICG